MLLWTVHTCIDCLMLCVLAITPLTPLFHYQMQIQLIQQQKERNNFLCETVFIACVHPKILHMAVVWLTYEVLTNPVCPGYTAHGIEWDLPNRCKNIHRQKAPSLPSFEAKNIIHHRTCKRLGSTKNIHDSYTVLVESLSSAHLPDSPVMLTGCN